jgi:hypothetical protein
LKVPPVSKIFFNNRRHDLLNQCVDESIFLRRHICRAWLGPCGLDLQDVTLKVNGEVVAQGRAPVTAALAFTANDCLDIGQDLRSPASLDYFDQKPFAFNGTIYKTDVKYTGMAKAPVSSGGGE